MPDCRKCSKHFPNRSIVDGVSKNVSKRKFCLDCSPFGKHNTRDLTQSPTSELPPTKWCSKCGRELSRDAFYANKKTNKLLSYCIECWSSWSAERCHSIKQACVDYKGGACENCGYSKCLGALEFHHRDPAEKDPNIFEKKTKELSNEVKVELDKCKLVCANCHREEHERERCSR